MNLDNIAIVHQRWITRLQTALKGKDAVDSSLIGNAQACLLDGWIASPNGQLFNDLPSLAQLKTAHDSFHQVAGEVASLIEQGKKSEATAMLNGALASKNEEMLQAVSQFRNEMKR